MKHELAKANTENNLPNKFPFQFRHSEINAVYDANFHFPPIYKILILFFFLQPISMLLISLSKCDIARYRSVEWYVLFVSLITMGNAILDPTNQLEGRLFLYCPTVRLRTDNLYQIKFWIFAEIRRPCRHCGQFFFGKLSSQQNRKRLVSDPSSGLVCNMV